MNLIISSIKEVVQQLQRTESTLTCLQPQQRLWNFNRQQIAHYEWSALSSESEVYWQRGFQTAAKMEYVTVYI